MRKLLPWLAWVLLSFSATLPGAVAPPGDWYETLAKPSWTPPGWVFPVVWTTLYVLMGTAAWLVWRRGKQTQGRRMALFVFIVQLVLNASWTPTFFGAHRILPALVIIALLWIAILVTILEFRPVSGVAALLLAPYLAWVSIAAALNFELWRLNTG